MTPSVPVPTDSVHKFKCLFGLALMIASAYIFSTLVVASTDRQFKYLEAMAVLMAKEGRNPAEEALLGRYTRDREVMVDAARGAALPLCGLFGAGIVVSSSGFRKWSATQREHDDTTVYQLRKLKAEVAKMEAEVEKLKATPANA